MRRLDPASDEAQALLAFESQRRRALIAADRAALDQLLHDDLIHVHSSGLVHGKADFIAHVGRMGGFIAIERGALDLRLGQDTALIAGPTRNTVRRLESGETAVLDGYGSVLVTWAAGRWQVLLSQLTIFRTG
ncbi:nuclear transport factor 2 family protein [Neotabrizicola shimadae]|uniref:Nuclear transport factor 2 family protein n=1 Tax=Neotabrizicola shimadae TaxID=2807096 RepID=A0A8G0ZX04_9RHOB|nr:nuclear transport factor 2 family protein [Neotabrizicola shimadae]QYZ69579.1 nuclear transport factor 2 family protein [Neotabrizicola shimadae]